MTSSISFRPSKKIHQMINNLVDIEEFPSKSAVINYALQKFYYEMKQNEYQKMVRNSQTNPVNFHSRNNTLVEELILKILGLSKEMKKYEISNALQNRNGELDVIIKKIFG